MPSHINSSNFNQEEETYIQRLTSYALQVERSSERLRNTRTPDQIKFAYNQALAEWNADYPGPVVPLITTPEWRDMWKRLKPVLTSNPKTDKE